MFFLPVCLITMTARPKSLQTFSNLKWPSSFAWRQTEEA